jgi:pimeloyl-ACP methyl ester carboxylesterase
MENSDSEMTTTKRTNESTITVGGTRVQMFSAGSGPPLVYLHGAGGNPGWQPYHQALAQRNTVYAPSHAGFNGTERPDWVYTITDVAHFNLELVQQLGLDQYILAGSSMGGWVAAEMAAMCHHNLKGLVLIDAVGIKPQKGEIAEIFMVSAQTRMKQRFYDTSQVPNYEQLTRELTPEEAQVDHSNREMASRLCWRPYMYNPSLPFYLRRVTTPTLVVWGRQDAIVPLECGELYQQALPNATLRVIDHCGHSPTIEKPQEFLNVVRPFISGLK